MKKIFLWYRKVYNISLTTENRRKLSPKAIFLTFILIAALLNVSAYCEDNDHDIDPMQRLCIKIMAEMNSPGFIAKDKLSKLYSFEFFYNAGEQKYISSIIGYLDEPDPELRIEALKVLGRIRDASALKAILKIARNDTDYYARSYAVDAIVSINDKNLKRDLASIFDSVKNDVRTECVYTLSVLADDSDSLFLKDLLKDNSFVNRAYCASALARIGDEAGRTALIKDLAEKDNSFRFLTAEALGKLNINDIASKYADEYKNSRNIEVKITTLRILGKLRAENTLPLIISLAKDKNRLIREKTAAALGDFGNGTDKAVLDALLGLLKDEDEGIRAQAVIAIGKLYDRENPGVEQDNAEKASVAIRGIASDSSKKVKAYAIRSLGLLQDKMALPYLSEAISDSDAEVRKYTVEAIGRIKDPSMADKLIPLFDDPDKNVQIEAVKSAGLLGNPIAKEAVMSKLQANDVDIKAEVLIALFRLNDPENVKRCIDGMASRDDYTRAASARALGYIGDKGAAPLLVNALNDNSPLVRASTVKSLGLLKDGTSLSNVIEMLKDRDREVVIEACKALEYFKSHESAAVLKSKLDF